MAKSKAAREVLRDFLVTGSSPRVPEGAAASLLVAAEEQGLTGLLHAAMESERNAAPSSLQAALAKRRRALLVRGVRQLELAARVQLVLAARGIHALPLKGAALCEDLYEGEGDRPMADVDLLALDGWRDAADFLQLEGFVVVARADHAWAFTDPVSGAVLELHHSVTSCPGLFPLDGPGLLARSRGGSGQVPRLPSPEDLLVHLSLHASFQHGLVLSLVQWLDFRRLLERFRPEIGNLVAAARHARAEAPVAAALLTAEAVVGAPLQPDLREWLEGRLPSQLRQWLAARWPTPLTFVAPSAPALGYVRWNLVPGRRFALLSRTLVPRTPGERAGALTLGARALRRGLSLLRRIASAPEPWRVSGQPSESEPESSQEEGLLAGCLDAFPHVRTTVTGRCMEPALAAGEQVLVAAVSQRAPRFGDVVLFRHPAGLRLHRLVLSRGRSWRTKADRAAALDPAISPRQVLGTVLAVLSRPHARPRRPVLALLSFGRAVLTRLRGRP